MNTPQSFRLTKNDSADIGFALACLYAGAIRFEEFKDWLYHVIAQCDAPPSYIFAMLDIDQFTDFKPRRIMGRTPSAPLTEADHAALSGIAFERGITDLEDRISRADACASFDANSAFRQKIRDFFPFLDMDKAVGAG